MTEMLAFVIFAISCAVVAGVMQGIAESPGSRS